MKFDLIIIGAGPGGYETAYEAAQEGLKVAIVSAGPVGGTCLNEGCIPTKALRKSAEDYSFLTAVCPEGFEGFFLGAQGRKAEIVSQLTQGITTLLSHPNISLFYGRASFDGPHKVVVSGVGCDCVDEALEAENIIIATGSVNAVLPIPGAELCISSREALEVGSVPASMVVIGGGVIGLELASIYATFGCKITIIEYCPEILPRFDSEISKRLRTSLKRRGIEFVLGAKVTGVSASDGIKSVSYENKKGAVESVSAEQVLMAVGRRPNLASLNLDEIGIEYTPKGIVVDSCQRTNVQGVYAVGDICGGMMLAHVAKFQGKIAL
ncbi:MAG: NAD(P)/FAD-dependent oxidoreductase, partial [Bacteroidales bacterium]|nr:NAD(P)/FAD-dependent oxidoreductase [Bacteroidales bacterium]